MAVADYIAVLGNYGAVDYVVLWAVSADFDHAAVVENRGAADDAAL